MGIWRPNFTEEEAAQWNFDVLDPTKLVPEELVPVTPLGKFILNKNTDDFFAETEQSAFSPANIVPGIDFSNDPLLQGRLFSYTDTHLHRLGTANFNQIPINKPVCPFHTNRRGGYANHDIYKGKANYEPNSVDGNWPREAGKDKNGFNSYPEKVQGSKLRVRPESFADHFSQATLHYQSLEKHEQQHIKDAYAFELSKVNAEEIRVRVVNEVLANIDLDLAKFVADELGLDAPKKPSIAAKKAKVTQSKKLSIQAFPASDIKQRKIAVLVHDGADESAVNAVKKWADSEHAIAEVLAPNAAPVKSKNGKEITVDGRQNGEPSITYDAIVVINGDNLDKFKKDGVAKHYVLETYKHLKPIVLLGDKEKLIDILDLEKDDALFVSDDFKSVANQFKSAIQQHRIWSREDKVASIPA